MCLAKLLDSEGALLKVCEIPFQVQNRYDFDAQTFVDSFVLYYQTDGIPVLALGGTCCVYSNRCGEVSGLRVKWSFGTNDSFREIMQPGQTPHDFLDLEDEQFIGQYICAEIQYRDAVRRMISPTVVQPQVNVACKEEEKQLTSMQYKL